MSASVLPNLIIIGAQKCGTTSLHHYLDLHPEVSMSADKELNFFVAERNWSRGVAWYARQFRRGTVVRGETSPNYTCAPIFGGVAKRMYATVPDARLIYLVRDPIARIVSGYVHAVADGREVRSIEDALAVLEGNRYVLRSRYHLQLEGYLECYPRARLLVLDQEELRHERRACLARVFRFLGVDDSFDSPRFEHEWHRSRDKRAKGGLGMALKRLAESRLGRRIPSAVRMRVGRRIGFAMPRPVLSAALVERLGAHLEADVGRLRVLTQQPFAHWAL